MMHSMALCRPVKNLENDLRVKICVHITYNISRYSCARSIVVFIVSCSKLCIYLWKWHCILRTPIKYILFSEKFVRIDIFSFSARNSTSEGSITESGIKKITKQDLDDIKLLRSPWHFSSSSSLIASRPCFPARRIFFTRPPDIECPG